MYLIGKLHSSKCSYRYHNGRKEMNTLYVGNHVKNGVKQ